ncbi:HAMP domain-containing histidine kinase [Candidatus Saccharibacteria bacterium]|nr:HAMP domain-containing histidine kinase [Candidatus Saccharibacteria bacterium]
MVRKDNSNDIVKQLQKEVAALRSEQRKLNKTALELIKRNALLAELNISKDEFIAIASHQLRTPASAVKQYIDLLIEGYAQPLTPEQQGFLQKAKQSNNRQLRIIDDLLQVARIDSESFKLNVETLQIRKIIKDVAEELREKIEAKNQNITYELPKKTIPVDADSSRLKMVFENIIDNASKYSPADSMIQITLRASQGYAMIDIKDQGVGIERKDFPKLFQKFSRLPNTSSIEVSGSGLGLYWVKKILQLHGGDISVKSKLGVGSTFTVKLPIKK